MNTDKAPNILLNVRFFIFQQKRISHKEVIRYLMRWYSAVERLKIRVVHDTNSTVALHRNQNEWRMKMERKFLESLGLEPDIIGKIMGEHGKAISKKEDKINSMDNMIDTLRDTISDRDKELKKFKDSNADSIELQKQVDSLKNENESLKSEKQNVLIDSEIIKYASKNAKDTDVVLAVINRDKIEIKDGKVVGVDEAVKDLQENKTFLFESHENDDAQNKDGEKNDEYNPGNQRGNDKGETDYEQLGKSLVEQLYGTQQQ